MINKLSNSFKSNVSETFNGEIVLSVENLFDGALNLFLLAYNRHLIDEEWAHELFNSTELDDYDGLKQSLELGINCKSILFACNQNIFTFERPDDERRIKLYQEITHVSYIIHDFTTIQILPLLYFMKTFDFKKISYIDDLNLKDASVFLIRDYKQQKEISLSTDMIFFDKKINVIEEINYSV